MKNAVRTSILSRRWRKLYGTLPNPKLECHKMFESVISHRLQTTATFVISNPLRCGIFLDTYGDGWTALYVRSGVRNLDLNFCCDNELLEVLDPEMTVFPFKPLYSARVLEYVQLSFCILEPNFEGPFNSLKEVILYLVPLLDKEVESILSSCPRLRLLNLRYCKLPCKVLVNALELRTLKIFRCEQVNEIGFCAPNLDCFAYFGKSTLSFSRSYVPNLGKWCLGLEFDNRPPHGFGGFVRSAPCLHTLCIQATPYQVQCIRSEMPTVWNVHRLSLHFIKESLDLRDIISLIALCPNQTRFDLSSHLCCLKYTERDEEVPLTCVHLKLVVLDGFKFYAAQKKFASHLIRCAPALVEMNIFYPLL
ncbi:hypothetical protein Leryth_017887 [Lithospermum erythrorhizon]|nr:hypothetical protein Leryth_017887 [Lithospermum erythrorhizon]